MKKIAIVHDFLVRYGGAEALVKTWLEEFPDADVFTLFYDEQKMGQFFPKEKVQTSFLQKWYRLTKHYTWMLPWMPKAIESFDLSEYDIILSSSAAFSHGVITHEKQKHISYIHSPMRWAWDWHFEFMKERKMSGLKKLVFQWVIHNIRIWDEETAKNPDVLLAASTEIQKRIQKYWRRESDILFPFADTERFTISKEKKGDYFLIVSQLVPYKKIELAIEASEILQTPLYIVGEGSAEKELKKQAGKYTTFLGAKYGNELVELMQDAKAFLFPGVDDFGITPVEAMACGTPVIAYKAAGALDTVKEGISGVFFTKQNMEYLKAAMQLTDFNSFDPEQVRGVALQFSKEKHLNKLKSYLS